MIDAKEAKFMSINNGQIKDIEQDISDAIQEAIKSGKFTCSVHIAIDTSTDIRNHIQDDMCKLGYQVNITDSRNDHTPSNQADWYDLIKVSWEYPHKITILRR